MAHTHSVYDTDQHFSIHPKTRTIANESPGKIALIQYDHNSERFTFELPRYIDGHDMSLCNVVQVHYNNVDSKKKSQSPGVYEVDDLQVSPEDDNVVICSWLISRQATQYAGALGFLLRFACVLSSEVEYDWHTMIYSGVSVSTGMDNSEIVANNYADVLERWRETLFGTSDQEQDTIESVGAEQVRLVKNAAQEILTTSATVQTREAAGAPVVVTDSAEMQLRGLTLYGRTTQAGTPTVDAPVELINAWDTIITVQGKNLLNPAEAIRTHATSAVTVDGDKLHITTEGASTYSGAKIAGFRLLAGVTYTLTATVEKLSGSTRICFRRTSGANIITSKSGTGKLALKYTPDETVDARVDLLVCEGTAMAGEAIFSNVQLEIGAEATEYEPYKDGGKLTVSNPDGLAGILVARGGNYTTDEGAQYIADYIDLAAGERVQMIGRIASYSGEDVGDVWQSSTGALSTGAAVVYALPEPVVTALDAETLAAYAALRMQSPTTVITANTDAGLYVRYIAAAASPLCNEIYVEPVRSAWEQRMLDRIDQCMIPMAALRDLPKASTGYIRKGQVLTGINYSAVHQEERGKRMVGLQIPLSTYYSALENPASKMYTEDAYQGDSAASSYYGIVCSGFVSYVIGSKTYIWTEKMAQLATEGTWSILDVATENDLFQIQRGDLLLNTVVTSGNGDHVRIVRDVVHDAHTGRLIGFNVSESWKPYCRTTFYSLADFLAQLSAAQPYRVVRMDDLLAGSSDYSLDVEPIAYSRTVYPDKGDGGTYTVGEEIWLYLPQASAGGSVSWEKDGSIELTLITDLEKAYVNGVAVYKLPALEAGEYKVTAGADDPCHVIVTE